MGSEMCIRDRKEVDLKQAIKIGMEEKAVEFKSLGSKIYSGRK